MPVIDATATRSTAPPMFVTITDRGTRGPRWVHARTQPLDRYERAEDRARGDHHQPLDALLAPRPMIDTTLDDRKSAEINQPPKAIAANGGSGNKPQLDKDAADKHIPVPGLRAYRHVANLSLRTGTNAHNVSGERRHRIRQRASIVVDGTIAFVLRPALGVAIA